MCLNKLDSIPQKVKDGLLSAKEAAMSVMRIAYTNPARFLIRDMDEDDRSDFLIDCLPSFEKMILRHDEKIGQFGLYMYHSMMGLKMSWYKKRRERDIAARIMSPAMKDIYEKDCERTLLSVASPSDIERRIFGDEEPHGSHRVEIKDIFKSRHGNSHVDAKTREKRMAMVLALKSVWYLEERHIDKLSQLCECTRDELERKVHDLRGTLLDKSTKQEDLEKRRDNAWFFVCKYRDELSRMDKNSSGYQAVKRKLDYQLASWKNKNSIIKRSRKIAPENSAIAKVLDIKPHNISTYLKCAKNLDMKGMLGNQGL